MTNLWVNRLIGDQQPDADKKHTYTTQAFYEADSPLLPSGLLGPVKEIVLPVTHLGSVATKDRQGREGAKGGFETTLTLNRKDSGITWNRALDTGGFMLGDDVIVEINIEANKKMRAGG